MTVLSRIALTAGVLCVATSVAVAQTCMGAGLARRHTSASHQSWSNSDGDARSRTTTIRLRDGDCELRVDARGEFTARPDLSGFASVDDFVEVEERDGDHNRKVRVSNISGGLDYRWSLDGRTGFDVDKDRWLSDALLALERRTAMLAK